MNHSEAIESNAAAAYLLGDLTDAERDAFEYHYIDCSVCSAAVRSGVEAPPERVVPEPVVIEAADRFRRVNPFTWIPASAAAAALAVVVGYQTMVIPTITKVARMETLTPGGVITGTMRASESEDYPIHFVGKRARLEHVDITDESYPLYRIELRDASRELVLSTEATAEEARSETGVPFLIRPLPAGRYVLTIEGVRKDGNRHEIDRRNVVVQ
jgi:hypothetical protein